MYFRDGNAVHTVHLWQPSGNRVNKPKQMTDKKKKTVVKKKKEKTNNIISTSTKKYSPKNKKFETTKIPSISTVQVPSSLTTSVNIIPEQNSMQFHNPEAGNCLLISMKFSFLFFNSTQLRD